MRATITRIDSNHPPSFLPEQMAKPAASLQAPKSSKSEIARTRLDPAWRAELQRRAEARTARMASRRREGRAQPKKVTESDLIREAIAAYLGQQPPLPPDAVPPVITSASQLRPDVQAPVASTEEEAALQLVRLELPAFLVVAMKKRARELLMGYSEWLSALLQFHLAGVPVLATPELFGLREANRELRAIGRNLNQLAKHANEAAIAGGARAAPDLPLLEQLVGQVDQLRAQIRSTVRASQGVWESGS